ncbi:hypothetical protein NHX12_025827, partial [Muraenolepis orangiensis]
GLLLHPQVDHSSNRLKRRLAVRSRVQTQRIERIQKKRADVPCTWPTVAGLKQAVQEQLTRVTSVQTVDENGDVIHPDQTCGIPGRKITDSLVLIRDTICYARDRNIRLIVLNLDFEKAFDRVSHQYLFRVLKKMGFPERALNLTDDYGLASGSKLNRGKTQALFYGPWAETDKTGLPLTINTTDIKILGEREPVSPVRGLAIGEPTTVWRNVNHPALPNRLRDLSWMTAHEILPVRSVMHSRGMGANPTCPRQGCGAHETVRHVLWECTAAGDQWAMAGSLQFPYLPAGEVLTAQLVLYGVSPKKVPPALFQKQWLTLSAIKDAIWTSRNLLVRKRMLIPPVAVIRMAAATLKVVVAAGGRPRTQPQRSLASVPIRTVPCTWPTVAGLKQAVQEQLTRVTSVQTVDENGDVIHPDQTCGIPGRKITDSLVLIRDTICYARDRNIRLIVLNLDFEKAFDRVSHQALNLTDDYGLASGSKLNRGKTQALFYGPWAETDKTGLPLTINTTDIKILGEREPVSPVRGLAIGEPTTVWRNVNHPALPNRLRDLSWMTAHEILPVRSVMHSRGMGANPTCPRQGCGAHETVRHVLWECTAAGDQWAMAGSLQFPYLPAGEVLTAQLVLYGVSPKKVPPALFQKQWLTLSAIKDAIWTSRNLLVRKRMLIPPVAVIRMAAATLKVVVAAGGRPRTQPQRSLASVPIRTWEPEPHN